MSTGLRILLVLGIVQTGLLGFIAVQVSAGGDARPAPTRMPSNQAPSPGVRPPDSEPHAPPLTAGQVRSIVREELRGLTAASTAPAMTLPPQERRERTEAVMQQIDYYRSLGSISPSQMQQLQSRIAALDERDRQPMLNRLVSAMNAGEITGEL